MSAYILPLQRNKSTADTPLSQYPDAMDKSETPTQHHRKRTPNATTHVGADHQNLRCEICDKSYTQKRALKRHFNSPNHCARLGGRPTLTTCTYCRRPFSRCDLCRRHEREVHEKRKRQVSHRHGGTSANATASEPSLPYPLQPSVEQPQETRSVAALLPFAVNGMTDIPNLIDDPDSVAFWNLPHGALPWQSPLFSGISEL